jgi:ATPase subunit of ABC transporter with duplicated ATPase domains
MFQVNNLSIYNSTNNKTLIHNLSFSLQSGDKIAIIGQEGTGKSCLVKYLANIHVPFIHVDGTYNCDQRVVYIPQNITIDYPNLTLEEYFLLDVDNNTNFEFYETLANFIALLNSFDIDFKTVNSRLLSSFSGGERIKIALAKALYLEPDILLIDEPTNDLDLQTIIFMEDFLSNIDMPILFISHDEKLLSKVANKIIHLEYIPKDNTTNTYFINLDYETYKNVYYSNIVRTAKLANKQRSEIEKKKEKFLRLYSSVQHQQNQAVRDPFLAAGLKRKMKALKSQEKRLVKEESSLKEVIAFENEINILFDHSISINNSRTIFDIDIPEFNAHNHLIHNIRFLLKGNDKVALIGKNGIGKTTFIKYLVTLIPKDIKYAYISQNYDDVLDYEQNPLEFLLNSQTKYLAKDLNNILASLRFKPWDIMQKIKYLSEGQKLKIFLLLCVGKEPDLLILDEPTRNISPLNSQVLIDFFNEFPGAIIAISHDRFFLESCFEKIYEFTEDGLKEYE